MLVFELWQACGDGDGDGDGDGCDGDGDGDGDGKCCGEFSVRLFYEAASPWEIRNATAPNPETSRVPVAIPRCVSADEPDGVSCPLAAFAGLVKAAIKPECVLNGASQRDEL